MGGERDRRDGGDRSLVRWARALLAGGVALGLAACGVERALTSRVGNALADGGAVYASDDAAELVGGASPFSLKLLEGLSRESPRDRGLLLALARGYTEYAYAYVEQPADFAAARAAGAGARERARALYLRARDYGLQGLELARPGFGRRLAADPEHALGSLGRADVPLAFWTAAAWGAAVALGRDDAELLGALPGVRLLAARALELDERYDAGALELLNASLSMTEPVPEPLRIARARQHLERALALSHGRLAAPYVVFAESVSLPTGNRAEFDRLITAALSVDPDALSEHRLANAAFRRRAYWLRARSDELFGSQQTALPQPPEDPRGASLAAAGAPAAPRAAQRLGDIP